MFGATGLGSIAGITGSIGSIDAAALTGAIKDSIISGALANFGSLGTFDVASIEGLIGSQILSITGTGNLANIAGTMVDGISQALGSVAQIQGQLTAAMTSVTSALGSLTTLTSSLNFADLSALSGTAITSLTASLGSISGLATSIIGDIGGSLTAAIGSVSGIATNIFSTGIASLGDLGGLTTALSGVTSSVTSTLTSSLGISTTSVTSGTTATSGSSASGSFGTPFGGMSTAVFYCNCSFNFRIMVSPPVGGTFMYQPGATILYQYGQIYRTGVWLLGLHSGSASCLIYVVKGCSNIGTHPLMYMVGTSM